MRWLPALLSLALPLGALAKKTADVDRFDEYHTKATSSTPVKLTDFSYKKLTTAPRDYTSAVLLTAMDTRFGCQLCREFQPEWDVLSRSWMRGDKKGESRVIFGTLDFSDGRDTFVSLGLQTAPVLLVFQPTTGPHAVASTEPLRYDFTNGPQSAEQVRNWLVRFLADRPQPQIHRPINWVMWLVTAISLLAGAGVIYKAWSWILPFMQNRTLWAGVCLIAILLFTGGHMFNSIRKVPYVASDGKGGISYFTGGFQNQLGMETQIIAALYGLLSFGVISLIVKAPRITDPKLQQFTIVMWTIVVLVFYSLLLSIFRIKNGGYPFSLPPFM